MASTRFSSILFSVKNHVAHITLNRPKAMNAIDHLMPRELREAVNLANSDPQCKLILLSGAGSAFCSGYDLKIYAESKGRGAPWSQRMPWDPTLDFQLMHENTECFMSLWRSLKPVLCKVRGFAIAGGSDIALCSDLLFMEETANIGYPPARLWGVPTTAMWVYRLGAERAKQFLLTGKVVSGKEAAEIGLISAAYPEEELDQAVNETIEQMLSIPTNQLIMNKMVINQAFENMGLSSTQRLATFFDGVSRHTPEGVAFKQRCEEVGFKTAVLERDAVFVDQRAKGSQNRHDKGSGGNSACGGPSKL